MGAKGGKFKFSSFHLQYIRVDSRTHLSKLVTLLVKEWEIPKPKLIISVKGAKANFLFKKELKQVFCHGLTKAAKSTSELNYE